MVSHEKSLPSANRSLQIQKEMRKRKEIIYLDLTNRIQDQYHNLQEMH
jgi:hypothetical protein